MKFLHATAYALMASQAALAVPVAAPVDDNSVAMVEYRSANPEHMALVALDERNLEKRINCQNIARTVRSIGTSKFTVVYITLATTLARTICGYVNGENCGDLALIIQTGLSIIYVAAAQYSGAQPETLPDGGAKRDIHDAYLDWWVNSLEASPVKFNYESISNLPFNSTEEALTRRDNDPALVSRVYFAGVTSQNGNVTMKHDIIANHFADGNTQLHLPVGQSSNTSEFGKRSIPSGSGFKISYTTRVKSALTASHQQEMAAFGAAAWASASTNYAMTDYIGFAETGSKANFYYRIIPESKSFGTNYESVDICGGMASYL